MSVQMAAFAFGCFLLLIALVGGGFQVKELTVPKVGRIPRLTSCAFSLVFLFLGFRPDFAGGGPARAAAPEVKVVERVVERPVLIPTPVPAPQQQQVLPASQAAPQAAAPTVDTEKNREAQSAAPPQAKKKVPWEQKPRQWLNRLKETAG